MGGSNWNFRNGNYTVDGTGSTATQGTSALLSVGSNSGGVFALNVQNNGAFTTGFDFTEVITGGTVNVTRGGMLNVLGSFRINNGGTVNVAEGGTINASGTFANVVVNAGGTLRGNGTLNATSGVINRGTIILDSDMSEITFNDLEIVGDYTQDSTGRIVFSLLTGDAMLLDQLDVTDGLMTLAGELAFDPLADFSSVGQYLSLGKLMDGTGTTTRTGTFDTVTGANLGDGTGLAIIYGSNFVDAQRAILGDLNLDGFVGIGDLNIVLGNWNQNVNAGVWGDGDPSGDGFIGIEDLNQVLGNWNAGIPPAGGVAIPEPGALLVMGLGGVALLRHGR